MRGVTTSRCKDSVSISRGNHSFKFGGEISYEKIVHDTLLDNYGVFTFNGSRTTGNAYRGLPAGLPSTMTQDAPVRKTDNGAYLSFFAQDDFRVHPRVTLNLGLRYDLQFPLTRSLRTASWRSCPGEVYGRRRTLRKGCFSRAIGASAAGS